MPSSASSRPHFDKPLSRVSDFQRRLRQHVSASDNAGPSTLTPTLERSLLQDLQRFEGPASPGAGIEVLDVMAASVRHARALRLLVEHEGLVLPLTVLPLQRVVHAPLPLAQWALLRWSALKVLQVEPAYQGPEDALPGDASQLAPLGTVLWALALNGARSELLPEIAAPAAYRIAPTADFSALDLGAALAGAVVRLRREAAPLAIISTWPGLDRERAMRLLNGLYLQSGLIVSRSHPLAVRTR